MNLFNTSQLAMVVLSAFSAFLKTEAAPSAPPVYLIGSEEELPCGPNGLNCRIGIATDYHNSGRRLLQQAVLARPARYAAGQLYDRGVRGYAICVVEQFAVRELRIR
ncbi:hypothetical protein C8R47DRAFT_1212678 [Mycena vitilis]|nr:hypothetical protein C8R47DRAFT_1212678 [Mycena vitilis]